jgi:hypothetical protein
VSEFPEESLGAGLVATILVSLDLGDELAVAVGELAVRPRRGQRLERGESDLQVGIVGLRLGD